MAKVQIKSERLTPFGGIFMVKEQFDSMLSSVIDSTLGRRCSSIIGYQYSEIVRSLMSVYFCGGSCVEDVTSHLMRHLSNHPTLRTCSSDTILRAIRELTQDNISYTSEQGKTCDFNTTDKLNTLLVNALVSTGELKEMEEYDVDFDHQFLETEKYDAKPTYKKFLGYRPGVYVIGDNIAYIENSDGNTNVRFCKADTHKRFFSLLESKGIRVNRFRADCGSCSKDIVSEIKGHCTHFYIWPEQAPQVVHSQEHRLSSAYRIDTQFLQGHHEQARHQGFRTQENEPHKGFCLRVHFRTCQVDHDRKAIRAEYLHGESCLCKTIYNGIRLSPISWWLESAYCLKSHCGVRGWCTRIRQKSRFCYHD